MYDQPLSQQSPVSTSSPPGWFTRSKVVIFGIILLLIGGLSLFYYFYSSKYLTFKTLATLDYDSQKAAQLLQDPHTIVFTKREEVMLANLKGEELILSPGGNNFSQKMANFRISRSRKYIAWQSETGIVGLDIGKRKVFLIYAGGPRQSYDLSPLVDNILYLTKDQLLEVGLVNASTQKKLQLPKPANPQTVFNHVKYSPNGKLAYIRSIHEFDMDRKNDIETGIASLKSSAISLFKKPFTTSVDLAPLWSNDSAKLIAWRRGLVSYDFSKSQLAEVIGRQNFDTLSPYAINRQDGRVAYIGGDSNNPDIIVTDSAGTFLTKVVSSRDKRLGEGFGILSDVGWLGENMIWFTFNSGVAVRDLWIIRQDGSDMIKVVEGIDKYSLDSVFMPITNAYTLY